MEINQIKIAVFKNTPTMDPKEKLSRILSDDVTTFNLAKTSIINNIEESFSRAYDEEVDHGFGASLVKLLSYIGYDAIDIIHHPDPIWEGIGGELTNQYSYNNYKQYNDFIQMLADHLGNYLMRAKFLEDYSCEYKQMFVKLADFIREMTTFSILNGIYSPSYYDEQINTQIPRYEIRKDILELYRLNALMSDDIKMYVDTIANTWLIDNNIDDKADSTDQQNQRIKTNILNGIEYNPSLGFMNYKEVTYHYLNTSIFDITTDLSYTMIFEYADDFYLLLKNPDILYLLEYSAATSIYTYTDTLTSTVFTWSNVSGVFNLTISGVETSGVIEPILETQLTSNKYRYLEILTHQYVIDVDSGLYVLASNISHQGLYVKTVETDVDQFSVHKSKLNPLSLYLKNGELVLYIEGFLTEQNSPPITFENLQLTGHQIPVYRTEKELVGWNDIESNNSLIKERFYAMDSLIVESYKFLKNIDTVFSLVTNLAIYDNLTDEYNEIFRSISDDIVSDEDISLKLLWLQYIHYGETFHDETTDTGEVISVSNDDGGINKQCIQNKASAKIEIVKNVMSSIGLPEDNKEFLDKIWELRIKGTSKNE